MVDEKWKVQNKLYTMKERMNYLERFIKITKKQYRFLNKYKLLKKRKYETYSEYFYSLLIIFLFDLDKVLGFYYKKYQAFRLLKNVKKEIITLTKEIKYYEYKLWSRSNWINNSN